jgi:hypothetical protein
MKFRVQVIDTYQQTTMTQIFEVNADTKDEAMDIVEERRFIDLEPVKSESDLGDPIDTTSVEVVGFSRNGKDWVEGGGD